MNLNTDPNDPIIEFSKVQFSFSGPKTIFHNLSLKLLAGNFYLIRGPSGAGKTTFLRLINRLEEPNDGQIWFDGHRLDGYRPPMLRRSIVYVQQTPTPINGTVRQNLLLAFSFKTNRDLTPPDNKALKAHLDAFLLNDIGMETDVSTLSVGQLQRICLIRGLLLNPQVLLLDEPASALDEQSARIVQETTLRLCTTKGLTVLMVSHHPFEPSQAKVHVLQIDNGSLKEGL